MAEVARQGSGLRGRIREALQASPLMDEGGLVRSLEEAYREMWRAWCGRQAF
jgi:protein O-GlcNAc transferase